METLNKKIPKIEIVHSDADYGTIKEVIKNYENVHEINLKEEIFKDGFSLDDLYNKYKNEVTNIKLTKGVKLVVVITHVLSESGIVLTHLQQLLKDLKEINKDIILIIDGAQALGNIYVNKTVINECDFYISCGHKWLLGSKTRGIVFNNTESLIKVFGTVELFEKSRSFSYYNYNPDQRNDETVSLNPDITLVSSLKDFNSIIGKMKTIEEHNTFLADTFRSEIYGKKFVKLIPPKTLGGIVTILVNKKYKIAEGLIK